MRKIIIHIRLSSVLVVLFLSLVVCLADASNLRISIKGHTDLEEPVLFYSNKNIDVYTDQESIKISHEALPNFAARIYFVIKDESARQVLVKEMQDQTDRLLLEAIESRKQLIGNVKGNVFSLSEKEAEERTKSFFREHEIGKYNKNIKYITMIVQYIAGGRLAGRAGRQPLGSKNMPLLIINDTIYNAPVTSSNRFYQKDLELIMTDNCIGFGHEKDPAYIGRQGGSHWSVLIGDLDPVYDSVRLDEKENPAFYKIIKELIKKISDAKQ